MNSTNEDLRCKITRIEGQRSVRAAYTFRTRIFVFSFFNARIYIYLEHVLSATIFGRFQAPLAIGRVRIALRRSHVTDSNDCTPLQRFRRSFAREIHFSMNKRRERRRDLDQFRHERYATRHD